MTEAKTGRNMKLTQQHITDYLDYVRGKNCHLLFFECTIWKSNLDEIPKNTSAVAEKTGKRIITAVVLLMFNLIYTSHDFQELKLKNFFTWAIFPKNVLFL